MPLQLPRRAPWPSTGPAATSAVAFDVSHLGTVRVAGPDALDRLQGALTNDLGRIGPGRAQYTHLLDEADASVLDDIIVWWVDDETLRRHAQRLEHRPGHRPRWRATGVDVADVTAERAIIAVQGPQARALLAPVSPEAAAVGRFHVGPVRLERRRRASWPAPATRARTGSRCAVPAEHAARVLGRRAGGRASSPPGWAPATRCASRPACRCTATSWARASPRCRPGWAGW